MSNRNGSPTPPAWNFLLGVLSALIVFVLGAGLFWTYGHYAAPRESEETPGRLYEEAWKIIESDYIGTLPSSAERTYGAIKGSVAKLDDPYSLFVEPEPAKREQEQLDGRFGGIGAYLTTGEDGRMRLDPMAGRPAETAGVVKDDILISVDGQTLPTPVDTEQTTNLLRGPIGTVVKITVLRGAQQLDFAIERAEIELPSVTWRVLEQPPGEVLTPPPLGNVRTFGYVRIERFSALTGKELKQALAGVKEAGIKAGLILDLRGNPGGLLDAGVAVAGDFLDGGLVLVERQANGSQRTYNAPAGGDAAQGQMVVLVDGGTASAAEIVAGALQDRGRARLVGEKTYGKGSVQHVHRLSDNSALHVTFARWFTPKGQQIDGHGLTPDVVVDVKSQPSAEGKDPILEAGIGLLQQSSPS